MFVLHRLSEIRVLQPLILKISSQVGRLICISALVSSLFFPTVLYADQTAPELPELFAQLKNTTDPAVARSIEEQIWRHWFIAPDENATVLLSQISQAMSARQYQLALQLCNQLVDSYPDFAEGWNRRATVQYQLNNHAESVADIRETIRLEPRHFGAISGLGLIFLRLKDYPAAIEAFEEVLAISPASQNAKRSIKFVRSEMGREI